jgi:hypothetical protein
MFYLSRYRPITLPHLTDIDARITADGIAPEAPPRTPGQIRRPGNKTAPFSVGLAFIDSGLGKTMCLLRGILLGILLTVGVAFVYDSLQTETQAASPMQERTLVNWDVVGEKLQALAVRVHQQWDRLIS